MVSVIFSLAERTAMNDSLQREIQRYKICKTELENLNQHIRDEHQALQLAFYHIEEKLRKAQVCDYVSTYL